jgi:type VI protein secretion system component VasF
VSEEPENLVLALLRGMRGDISELRADMRGNISELRAEMHSQLRSLRADVASDIIDLEKRLNAQIAGLRRAVMEYHSSAIGHGVLISEFEERLRRIEQRLDITTDTH